MEMVVVLYGECLSEPAVIEEKVLEKIIKVRKAISFLNLFISSVCGLLNNEEMMKFFSEIYELGSFFPMFNKVIETESKAVFERIS